MTPLTAKQEAFCQAVVSGVTQIEAYRTTHNTDNMTLKSAGEKASRMMATTKIRARVNSLKAEMAQLCLWTREDSVKALKGVVQSPDRAGDIIASVKELNSMHGYNAPITNRLVGADGEPLSMAININFVAPKK
jgi:hypothetical protein